MVTFKEFFDDARRGLEIIDKRVGRGEFLYQNQHEELCACAIGCHFIATHTMSEIRSAVTDGVGADYLDSLPFTKEQRYWITKWNDDMVRFGIPADEILDRLEKNIERTYGDQS